MTSAPKLYTTLAPWFPLLTAPADYADEAAAAARLLESECTGPLRTLLELGSGGGNNASHLKSRYRLTLTDLSPAMLDVSRALNPECEHVVGDMRDLRLSRTFDAVFVHDAVSYLTTPDDLARALMTAFVHLRPGGAALFCPDFVRETFVERTNTDGHDSPTRRLRYVERFVDPDPTDTTYECRFEITMEDRGQRTVAEDVHVCGLFPRATWIALAEEAGFHAPRWVRSDDHASDSGGGDLVVASRPATSDGARG